MKVLHIIGQPGSGKTTLVTDIVKELCRQNISVGTIKHSAHTHELDKPGKDSFLQRKAGAAPAAMMTRDMAAVYLSRSPGMTPATLIQSYYSHLDIVLIEGWISGPYDKIEVFRECVKRPFLFPDTSKVKALVTDDSLETKIIQQADAKKVICIKRSALADILAFIIKKVL
ncbi:MAG: molybdopterin-guanine dinucleotide biosynthesis protein B [Desulfobacula sp.]|uniref:molybdopterin-guanine dinucleotide biosynthesis protein B n=1 Tax=Desulfobacula sp. TaxID=2593537 RepID=UPI001EC0AA4E|nr:molybdopterin-guanine dinucleotide biosynthesis protein B [Desulfobacula sp.]